jgi:hypothetical protein
MMVQLIDTSAAKYGHPSVRRTTDGHNYIRFQLKSLLSKDGLPERDVRALIKPYMHVSDIPDSEVYGFNVKIENVRIDRARAA